MGMETEVQKVNETEFCRLIESIAETDLNYIESVIMACEQCDISPELGARMLSKPIIEKIQQEGESINLLPKKSKLPV
tara:strand:- start:1088 stop:1321 length:234 start_codon:yes stop_codon:yes gene_type:complete